MSSLPGLPRLYCVVDAACFPNDEAGLFRHAAELFAAGATLVQYRNKNGPSRQLLSHARELRRLAAAAAPGYANSASLTGRRPLLIMNDRADLALAAGFDGVHLGQDDLSAAAARLIVGAGRLIGCSTHSDEQVREADAGPCDYIAIGPVFPTASKENPGPLVGLAGVEGARRLTQKPIVAIGGITRANCRSVASAGSDSVAVIRGLLSTPYDAVRDFLTLLG